MTQLAIGYGRGRSLRQDARAPSMEEQRIACERYAAEHGMELTEFNFDEAGRDPCAPRPGLSHTLDTLSRGGVTTLVIDELTTLGRDEEDVLQTLHFLFHNAVALHTVAGGRFVYGSMDSADPTGADAHLTPLTDKVVDCGRDGDDGTAGAMTKRRRPEKAVRLLESDIAGAGNEARSAICYVQDRPRSPHKKKLTLEEQRRSCLEYAAKHGLLVTAFHSDELAARAERPGFEKTLRALGRDGHKALVIYDIATLGGDHDTECGVMDLLIEHDVEFHTVVEGQMRGFGYGSRDMTDPSTWPAAVTSEIPA